ncbi:MAG: preprotein translocase subunit SecA, partial [Pseudomonadota bacterium]
ADLLLEIPVSVWLQTEPNLTDDELLHRVVAESDARYADKVALVGAASFAQFEHNVMLQSLDSHWRDHLSALDQLRQGIHLRGYAQKNPKQEYKREAFELFELLLDRVRADVTRLLMTVQIRSEEDVAETAPHADLEHVEYRHDQLESEAPQHIDATGFAETSISTPITNGPKVGRNDPCPCGSGKKFKQCCGKLA